MRCGCRCPQCAAASRDYARALTRARAYGQTPRLVDVGTVRAHLGRLAEHGIGQAQVAALSGIGRSITQITHIQRPRGPRRGVTPRVAAAILGVDPSLDNAAATARVDDTGTRRRPQALVFVGWPLTILQQRLGLVWWDRVLAAGTVLAATARVVRAFYDTHWDHPSAVSSTPQGRRAVTLARARARAARHGFLLALAWDDDTIDDPSTVADLAAVRPRLSPPRLHVEDSRDAGADRCREPVIGFLARLTAQVGQAPPLRGFTPEQLRRFAIACRASALILERQSHPQHAGYLRRLAAAADAQSQNRQPRRPAGRLSAA